MRASSKIFRPVAPHLAGGEDGKRVDVWFAYLLADLDNARAIAEWLDARGYTSAPGVVLYHHDKPRTNVTPMQARCVIALWSPEATQDQQVQADARTAGYNGNLIEVCVRKGAPEERYSDDALIVFNRLDLNSDAAAWRALLARIRKHCGEPPRKPSEFRRYARTAFGTLACVTSLGGAGYFYAEQSEQRDLGLEAASPTWAPPAATIDPALIEARKRPSLTPTTDLALAAGGPTPLDYVDYDRDTGIAPEAPSPAAAPVEAEAPKPERVIQGPEQ